MLNHDTRSTGVAGVRQAGRALTVLGILLAVIVTGARAQDDPLEKARAVYNDGNYSQAAELLDALARDETVDLRMRRDALRYLGRAYIAQSLMEDARQAVVDLLELEPPLVELDPDVEPPPIMDFYFEEREKMTGHEVPTADPGIRTLAVMDFRNYALDDQERWDPMQWGFASMMIEQLGGATDLKLVERENLQYVLDELNLQRQSGVVDEATAVRMGKVMGAHAMVLGSIFITGRRMRLGARVVKVETGEVLLGESVDGRASDFFDLLEKLSLKVARSVNSTLTETEIGARTETRSLDAARAYADGLKLAEDGGYEAAREKFLQALDYDPSYTRAQKRIDSLVPILAAR